jgi:hypothetical protein
MSEYGETTSIEEAIEILAMACVDAGIAPPVQIVFPKGELQKYSHKKLLALATKVSQEYTTMAPSANKAPSIMYSTYSKIELKEES